MTSRTVYQKPWSEGEPSLTQQEVREYIAYRHAHSATDKQIANEICMAPQRISELVRNEKDLTDRSLLSITRNLSVQYPSGIPLMELTERPQSNGAAEAFGPNGATQAVTTSTIAREDYDQVCEALSAAQGVIGALRDKVQALSNHNATLLEQANSQAVQLHRYAEDLQELAAYKRRVQGVLSKMYYEMERAQTAEVLAGRIEGRLDVTSDGSEDDYDEPEEQCPR